MALRDYSREGDLLGPSADSVLPAEYLVRLVDELVETIGVQRLNHRCGHTAGEPAYDMRLLCKVFIYGYARRITSSREIARQCLSR